MKIYYYIETYFKDDDRPYLMGDNQGLFIAKTIENANNKISTLPTNAKYKVVEVFEHLTNNRSLYPHLSGIVGRNELYHQIENEIKQNIAKFV